MTPYGRAPHRGTHTTAAGAAAPAAAREEYVIGSEGEAVVPFGCDRCPDATGTFGEMIVDGRLHWSVWHACPAGPVQECGRGEPPDRWRRALLDQCGTYRLRLTGGPRVAVMRVLREFGIALPDIPATTAALTGPGLPGTEAELRLLAARFDSLATTVLVAPPR